MNMMEIRKGLSINDVTDSGGWRGLKLSKIACRHLQTDSNRLLLFLIFSCRLSLGVLIGGALLYRTLRPRENKFALKIAAKQKAREINRSNLEAALTINGKVRDPHQ